MGRFTLGRTLVGIAGIGLAAAALRGMSDEPVMALLILTYVGLVVALIGAGVRRGAGWVGFAVAGWAYFLPTIAVGPTEFVERLPTSRLIGALCRWSADLGPVPSGLDVIPGAAGRWIAVIGAASRPNENEIQGYVNGTMTAYNAQTMRRVKAGHLILCWSFGAIGAVIAKRMSRDVRAERSTSP